MISARVHCIGVSDQVRCQYASAARRAHCALFVLAFRMPLSPPSTTFTISTRPSHFPVILGWAVQEVKTSTSRGLGVCACTGPSLPAPPCPPPPPLLPAPSTQSLETTNRPASSSVTPLAGGVLVFATGPGGGWSKLSLRAPADQLRPVATQHMHLCTRHALPWLAAVIEYCTNTTVRFRAIHRSPHQ
jgi:hypothetical protein